MRRCREGGGVREEVDVLWGVMSQPLSSKELELRKEKEGNAVID